MTDSPEQKYKETVSCEPRQDEGLIFIKVVAMPHEDAVEFDVALNRPGFRRHLAAINYGLGGGGYEHETLYG